MKDVIRLKKLEAQLDKAYLTTSLSWKYRILNGEKEVLKLGPKDNWFGMRMSGGSIGDKCLRRVWFHYHHVAACSFQARMYRLFDFGHVIEQMTLANINAAGIDVREYEEIRDGRPRQFEYSAFDNRFVCKLDGILPKGVEEFAYTSNLEIKSCNDNKFKKFVREGCKNTEPRYYAQCQAGMALNKNTACVFIATNKNDSKVYCELIKYDREEHDRVWRRIKKIIENPYKLVAKTKSFCKNCDYLAVCNGEDPLRRCRTCKNYQWEDNKCGDSGLDVKYGSGCDDHTFCEPFNFSLFG